ncbi:MAG: VWA domain-containing protein [Methanomassiliicoccales archaeon]|nr:MAG: VWA domain-containing protein [Methanomassiliicoccales archaeon]
MNRKQYKKKGYRITSIFMVVLLILGGAIVIDPFEFLVNKKNASAASMTVFYEDFDTGTGALPWVGASGIWTDRVNYPSGFGTSNWQVIAGPSPPSPSNCLYSGPEQWGFYDGIAEWYYGTCTNAETPSIDLRNASSATLSFMHLYNFPGTALTGSDGGTAIGYGDGGMVFLSKDYGATWDYIEPIEKYPGYVGGQPTWVTGGGIIWGGMNPYEPFGDHDALVNIRGADQLLLSNQGGGAYVDDSFGWVPATFDLSAYVGYEVTISFRYTQNYIDQGLTSTWWYIDDVQVDKDIIDGPSIQVIGSDSQVVDQGQTYSYILNITNWKDIADWIDLNFFSTLGWTTELLNYTTFAPLTDDGGIGGLVDIGWLGPGNWIWIRVNISVPLGEEWNTKEVTYITATSFLDPTKSASEELHTSTPNPDVGVYEIYIPAEKPPGEPIQVDAIIMNYGTVTATFLVRCTVEGDLLIQPTILNSTGDPSEYNWVISLDPGDWIIVNWTFTPTIVSTYTITVTTLLVDDQEPANNISSGICYVQLAAWSDDCEIGGPSDPGAPGGREWVIWDSGVGDTWEWGFPDPSWGGGPVAAQEGIRCWGVDLDNDYDDDTQTIIYTPMFNFSNAVEVTITFWHWYDLQGQGPNNEDYCDFTFDTSGTDGTYVTPPIQRFKSDTETYTWEQYTRVVTSIAAGQPQIRFAWYLNERNNPQSGQAGWYIDNVTIYAYIPEAELVITEIMDNDSSLPVSNEYIEVYNEGNANASLADFAFSSDGGITWLTGTWSGTAIPGILQQGEYAIFTVDQVVNPNALDDEGGKIWLVNISGLPQGIIHDKVEYGQEGLVPDPITGESVARWWNGVIYTDDWARESSPSMGSAHIGNRTVVNPLVVLNEVYFNPDSGERFIELIYAGKSGDPDVDCAGWVIVVDGIPYTIPAGPWETNLNSTHSLYVVNETMAQSAGSDIFTFMDVDGDNIYLFNSTGSLVDMVGWSQPHPPGTSISRVPDGYGITIGFESYAKDGYDDPTSIEAGWQFVDNPTMGIIVLESDQTKVGDLGQTISYQLTLINDVYGDVIDLFNQTFGEGWLVELYNGDGTTKLEDTNNNGIIDTGILGPLTSGQIINLTVKVSIPTQKAGDYMDTIITAVPQHNQNGSDIVTLRTETYPHIEVDKYAAPTEIWVNGSAPSYAPQETTITIKAWGAGLEQFLQFPQDVVFVIDKSYSMEPNPGEGNDPDPDGAGPRRPARIEAAWDYIDNMSEPDRAAVVKFSDNAILVDGPDDVPTFGDGEQTVWNLSSQYSDIKNNTNECGTATGGTALGFALEIAVDQLIANGNSSHIQVIIALTDGETWDATRAYQQAKRAADNGIVIYTIGLGDGLFSTGLPIWFLEHFIANTTGGKYYPAATPEALFGIYAQIGQEINEIAGKQITVGMEKYLVRDVLMPGIHFVPGTFTIPPDNITVNATGYTWLQWEKQYITINESWICSFKVRSDLPGHVQTNDYENSRVRYKNWNNITINENFPHVNITVKPPMPDPPELRIFYNGITVILDWTPPLSQIIDYYLIYRSPTRDDFGDFSSPWRNTSFHPDPLDPPLAKGDRTSWNDTTAFSSSEYYYIVRAVNSAGEISATSNTVGKYNRTFLSGTSTFSLPLEPSYSKNVSWYIEQIGSSPSDYIKWCDPATQTWVTHHLTDGEGVNDSQMKIGEGYEIYLENPTEYTFWGKPASSIRFLEGQMPRPGNFGLSVNSGDVFLSWDEVPGADHYIIYRAPTREGLNNRLLSPAAETGSFGPNAWMDPDPYLNIGGTEFYYAVGAVNSSTMHTTYNTTYAIGVWIGDYPAGYSAIGLPVKTYDSDSKTIDEYCDDIPNTVGINYYLRSEGRWIWHRFNMPYGVYDVIMGYTDGYQLSTSASAVYHFMGR